MSEHADDRPDRKLSGAKRDILARAPEGWFLVAAVVDGDNQRAGVHLQQMFQAGLVARRDGNGQRVYDSGPPFSAPNDRVGATLSPFVVFTRRCGQS